MDDPVDDDPLPAGVFMVIFMNAIAVGLGASSIFSALVRPDLFMLGGERQEALVNGLVLTIPAIVIYILLFTNKLPSWIYGR